MPKIKNMDANKLTAKKEPFVGSNLYAEWLHEPSRYVVYSYHPHFPLHIYDAELDRWFSNGARYSTTSSRHYTQAHPLCRTTILCLDKMLEIASLGAVRALLSEKAAWRIAQENLDEEE